MVTKVTICHRQKRKLKKAYKKKASNLRRDSKRPFMTFSQYCNKKLRSLQPNTQTALNGTGDDQLKVNKHKKAKDKSYKHEDRILKQCDRTKFLEAKFQKQKQLMRKSIDSEKIADDDEEIGHLSKLLGITDRKRHLGGFHYDGLTNLLDVCFDENQHDLNEIGSVWTDYADHCCNDSDKATIGNEESIPLSKTQKISRKKKKDDANGSSFKKKVNDLNENMQLNANANSTEKYVGYCLENLNSSTAKSCQDSDRSSLNLDDNIMARRVKALFNRLNSSNLSWAIKEYETIYHSTSMSRNAFRSQLWECLHSSAMSTASLPDILLLEHAAFIALINVNVDSQVGSFVLNKMCTRTVDVPITRFVSALCTFRVSTVDLVMSMLTEADTLDDPDMIAEMCIGSTRLCSQLRKYAKFKSLVKSLIARDSSKRCRILLEESLRKLRNDDSIRSLLKIVNSLCKHPLSSFTCTSSHNELKQTYFTMEQCSAGKEYKENMKQQAVKSDDIAKRLGMNTQLRSSIVHEILKAQDYSEATVLLLQLNITKSQKPEIINVLMSLMFKEKTFNPFYVLAINKLCNIHKLFTETTRQRTWEKLKDLPSKTDHLVEFVSFLILNGTLSLTILKAVQFATMNETTMNVIRDILLHLFEQGDTNTLERFIDIAKRSKQRQFCHGLRLFIEQFIIRLLNSSILTSKIKNMNRIKMQMEKVITILNSSDTLGL